MATTPAAEDRAIDRATPPRAVTTLPLPDDFLQDILSSDESTVAVPLPGGRRAHGRVTHLRRDHGALVLVQGDLAHPGAGRFMFQRQTLAGKAGPLAGFIYQHERDAAWQVRPDGDSGRPALVRTTADSVLCRALAAPPDEPQEIPATHPTDDPIPPGENGIVQLQSLPGATAVIYLDFDGEERVFDGWGYVKALPFAVTANQIHQVWQGVCEDFQPFQINVTTIRAVYDAAPPGHRMQVIVTPTDTAAPGKGGIAYTGSFNWTGDMVCWAFRGSGKNAIEIISHELGHTLGLSHDGRTDPYENYYKGHDDWAPIMGLGYYKPVTQWSKGEYPNANNKEDDLKIIATNNNGVRYRDDDHRSTFTDATWLDIRADGSVSNEGIIRNRDDRDAFRFKTNGGTVTLNVDPIPPIQNWPNSYTQIANLDIKAELLTASGWLVASSASTNRLSASIEKYLAAGDYYLRVSGSGKGSLSDGYSDYASLGSYTISGTVGGGVHAEHFSIAENPAAGTTVGNISARGNHGAGTLSFAIASGNSGGAFALDPASGTLRVADAAQFDFETLSTRWDDPAEFELFVTISDHLGILTESLRVVVQLLDVNEPPVFSGAASITLPANLPVGMRVADMRARDPDRGDYVTHAIVAGNAAGHFSIDASTGLITLAAPLDFHVTPEHQLTLRASDHRTPANTTDFVLAINLLDVPAQFIPGGVVRTLYNDIPGATVADLTASANFPDKPHVQVALPGFDSGLDQGDNYGSTLAGYLIVPAGGSYTFWLSANEAAELRISPDTEPADATVRAGVSAPTPPGVWTAAPGQQSAPIELSAGQICYIEVRHKESTGGDHVQVAWQGPGMTEKQIIPGVWLAPHDHAYAPWAPARTLAIRSGCQPGALVGRLDFIEPNLGQQVAGYAITGGNDAGCFTIDADDGEVRVATGVVLEAGSRHQLTIAATDTGSPPLTGEATMSIEVIGFDERLHAWWKLDETGGTTASDSSGNGRHAQLAGVTAWIERAAANPALLLDANGGGSFSRADYDALWGATSFTVAAWVKVPSSHASDGVLIQQSATPAHGGPGRFRVMVLADGRVNFSVAGWDSGYNDSGDQFNLTSSQAIDDGQWHHVACVREGESGRIIIDGAEAASGSGSPRSLESESIITVGADAVGSAPIPGATVDDVRIYAEALSATQLMSAAGTPKLALRSPVGQSVCIPADVGLLLETAASDPDGPPPLITWEQTAGPGTATFCNHPAGTGARFSAPGVYQLRATATDGSNSISTTLDVEVGMTPFSISNLGPEVSAGPDRTLQAGAAAVLTGSAADDGLPQPPAALVLSWQQLGGPGAVVFSNPALPQTHATIDTPGEYLLRLVADDGAVKTFDDVIVMAVAAVPFAEWQEAEFSSHAGDPLVAGELADPDRDGRCNLLEYALGSRPSMPDAPPVTTEMAAGDGGPFMRLVIPRNPAASGLTMAVEASDDLGDAAGWSGAGLIIEDDAPERLIVRDAVGGPRRFFRLRVVR